MHIQCTCMFVLMLYCSKIQKLMNGVGTVSRCVRPVKILSTATTTLLSVSGCHLISMFLGHINFSNTHRRCQRSKVGQGLDKRSWNAQRIFIQWDFPADYTNPLFCYSQWVQRCRPLWWHTWRRPGRWILLLVHLRLKAARYWVQHTWTENNSESWIVICHTV